MFTRTRAVAALIAEDLRKASFAVSIITQCVVIAYYIYALAIGSGIQAVNITLLSVAVAYLVTYIVLVLKTKTETTKKIKKGAKLAYRCVKYAIHGFTVGMGIYVIYNDPQGVGFGTIVLTALSALGFVSQLAIELTRQIVGRYISLLQIAISEDVKPIVDTVNKLSNPKATAMEMIGKPIERLARRFAGKKEEEEVVVEESKTRREQKVEDIAAAYEEKNTARREEIRTQREGEYEAAKQGVKDNIGMLFNAFKGYAKEKFGGNVSEGESLDDIYKDDGLYNKGEEINKDDDSRN